jgi:ribulose-phosphate 3-epimerase
MKLSPAILTDSMTTLIEELESVKQSTQIDRVHVDIIDGQFADNLTLTPLDLTVVDFGQLGLDLHLMVEEPMDVVFECEAVHEYLPIRRLIGQVERMSSQADFIHEVKQNNWQAGLALDIYTPIDAIDESSWEDIDVLLLMGIEAGYQGQIFNVHALEKIKEVLHHSDQARKVPIILDGGVKANNVGRILQAGATEVTVGSFLWKNQDRVKTIAEVFAAAEKSKLKPE